MIKEDDRIVICDLESTHGTFVDGERIQSKVEIPLQVDSRIKFGASSRDYFIRRKEEASSGESFVGGQELFANPVKVLRDWFEQAAGEKLYFQTTTSTTIETHRLALKLPIASEEGTEEILIEAGGSSREDAEKAIALLACQKLQSLGILEPSTEESSWVGWKRAKEEMLAEEEGLILEDKRPKQETKEYNADVKQLMMKREDLFEQLMAFDDPEEDGDMDEVDRYMRSLTAAEKEKIQQEIEEIDTLIKNSKI